MLKGKKKLILIALVLLVVIFFALLIRFTNSDNKGMVVNVAEVQKDEITSTIITDGIIEAKDRKKIASKLPYLLEEVLVEEGDKVKKGDILAKLETRELRYKVETAKIELELQKEELKSLSGGIKDLQLQKDYQNAKLTYENAQKAYQNSQTLFAEKAISKTELDEDELEMNRTKNEYELARQKLQDILENVELKKREVQLQELNLKMARETLEKAVIKSPLAGTVVHADAKAGLPADGVSPLFIIDDIDNLEVEVKISEYDINDIVIGQQVKITGDAFKGQEFTGKVSYIAPTAVAKDTGSGKEINVDVKISILNISGELKPGFSADVSIKTGSKKDALVVPYEALYQRKDGSNVVFKVTDNQVSAITVLLGIEGDLSVELISDELQAGDKIVINPTESIKDGMQVNVLNQGGQNDHHQ